MRALLFLIWAGAATAEEIPRILTIGDSVMAWNGAQSIPSILANELAGPVLNESVSGARFSHRMRMLVGPMDIRSQVPRLSFDWVVVTGGANDLAGECECGDCADTLDEMITADAVLGSIPDFVEEITLGGAQMIWAHYYDSPAAGGPFDACMDEFAILKTRIERLATQVEGLTTLEMSEAIDPLNLDHYDPDRVHPSPDGSRRIAELIAARLRVLEE